ncbi:MAG: hypothetical protein ABSA21_07630 [Candidatus Limnocylindrales bacterium]|jgi:hypothetical protein
MTSVPGHLTPLRLSQRASFDLTRSCPPRALVEADWLGTPVAMTADPARPGTRRYLTDLSLPVRDHSPRLTFKKAAYVDLGEVRGTRDGCEVEISWQSSSLAPLFPVFAGRVRLTATEITLEGYYAPPGGEVGAVLDRAFLNIAARGTARWFLEQIAAALGAAQAPEPKPRVGGSPPS